MRTVTIRYTVNSTNDKVPHAEEPRDRETITRGSGTAVGRVTGPLTATYPLAGKAPSSLLTITLAAIYPKQTLESSVKFRDCADTRDVSII
jgi:hypothetical protein